MRPIILLGVLLFPTFSCAAQWTPEQKRWALASSGILAELNHVPYDRLESNPGLSRAEVKALIVRDWGAHSRTELVHQLVTLLTRTKPHSDLVWDYARAIHLARWGFTAGYLHRAETWGLILFAAQRIQAGYSSWQEMGAAYLDRRALWVSDDVDRRWGEYAYRTLVMDLNGPWRNLPWNLDLGNGAAVPASTAKTAELWIQQHTSGLACVRLHLPEPGTAPAVLPAVGQMIGCEPRITSDRLYEKRDWVLEAECVQPGSRHFADIVSSIHIEPVADLLRRSGHTELILYVQHTPSGVSRLSPPVRDTWMGAGMQEYADRYSLRTGTLPALSLSYGMPPARLRTFQQATVSLVIAIFSAAWLLARLIRRRGRTPVLANLASALGWFVWLGWLVLAITYSGLDVAAFRSTAEGSAGQFLGLFLFAPAGILVRCAVEWILLSPSVTLTAPVLKATFWRSFAEVAALSPIVFLTPRTYGWEAGPLLLVTLLALAAVLVGWDLYFKTLGRRRLREGELHDAVFALASLSGTQLKRVYLESDNPWRKAVPGISAGCLILPEQTVRILGRSELDAVVQQGLGLLRKRYTQLLQGFVLTGMSVWFFWVGRLYFVRSESLVLFLLLASAAVLRLGFVSLSWFLRRQSADSVVTARGTAQAWVSALARMARAEGRTLSDSALRNVAKKAGSLWTGSGSSQEKISHRNMATRFHL